MHTIDSAVVMSQSQFLELLASGGEGPRTLGILGITPDDLPLSRAFTKDRAVPYEHLLATVVAAATETLQIMAPMGSTPSVFAFRDERSCAVFLVGEDETTALTCSVEETAQILEVTVAELQESDTDWSVHWHSDGAAYQVYVNPDGTVAGKPPVSLDELLAAFSA